MPLGTWDDPYLLGPNGELRMWYDSGNDVIRLKRGVPSAEDDPTSTIVVESTP